MDSCFHLQSFALLRNPRMKSRSEASVQRERKKSAEILEEKKMKSNGKYSFNHINFSPLYYDRRRSLHALPLEYEEAEAKRKLGTMLNIIDSIWKARRNVWESMRIYEDRRWTGRLWDGIGFQCSIKFHGQRSKMIGDRLQRLLCLLRLSSRLHKRILNQTSPT